MMNEEKNTDLTDEEAAKHCEEAVKHWVKANMALEHGYELLQSLRKELKALNDLQAEAETD